jgi:hypothetical protein
MSVDITPQQEVEAALRLQRYEVAQKMDTVLDITGMDELTPAYKAVLAEFDRVIDWYVNEAHKPVEPVGAVEPTLEDWAKIPVGTKFGFGRDQSGAFPYTKLTKYRYGHKGEEPGRHIANDTTPADRQRGLHWKGQK